MHIRKLDPADDLDKAAKVYVSGWQWGYAGLLEDTFLQQLTPEI